MAQSFCSWLTFHDNIGMTIPPFDMLNNIKRLLLFARRSCATIRDQWFFGLVSANEYMMSSSIARDLESNGYGYFDLKTLPNKITHGTLLLPSSVSEYLAGGNCQRSQYAEIYHAIAIWFFKPVDLPLPFQTSLIRFPTINRTIFLKIS